MARKDVTAVINIGRKAMREKEEIADVPMEGLPNPLMLENQLWKLKKKKKKYSFQGPTTRFWFSCAGKEAGPLCLHNASPKDSGALLGLRPTHRSRP